MIGQLEKCLREHQDVLGINHVAYRLVHALVTIDGKEIETWISVSDNFRKDNEEKLTFDMYYDFKGYR